MVLIHYGIVQLLQKLVGFDTFHTQGCNSPGPDSQNCRPILSVGVLSPE